MDFSVSISMYITMAITMAIAISNSIAKPTPVDSFPVSIAKIINGNDVFSKRSGNHWNKQEFGFAWMDPAFCKQIAEDRKSFTVPC